MPILLRNTGNAREDPHDAAYAQQCQKILVYATKRHETALLKMLL